MYNLRTKAKYLAVLLNCALSHYANTVSFMDICNLAIKKIDDLDFDGCVSIEELVSNDSNKVNATRIRHPRTLMRWLQTFRCSNNFPNPYHLRKNHWRCKLPSIFRNNPELHQSFLEYARSNLDTLSGEMLHTYMFNTALPALAQKIQVTGLTA